MKLSETNKGIMEFARRFSNTNSTTYPDADLKASVNQYQEQFTVHITDAMDDWDFGLDYATCDFVAGQQEYPFDTTFLKIKQVEVTYDGVTWKKVRFHDLSANSEPTDTATIGQNYNISEPYGDLLDNSIFIDPIPTATVTAGMKVWFTRTQDELVNSTDEPVFASPFHIGLAYGAAKDWLEQHITQTGAKERLAVVDDNLLATIARMKDFYKKHIQDRDYEASYNVTNYE